MEITWGSLVNWRFIWRLVGGSLVVSIGFIGGSLEFHQRFIGGSWEVYWRLVGGSLEVLWLFDEGFFGVDTVRPCSVLSSCPKKM